MLKIAPQEEGLTSSVSDPTVFTYSVPNSNHSVRVIDRIKESVCLTSELNAEKMLTISIQERGLATLRKYGARLNHLDASSVRIVSTDTFRTAKKRRRILISGRASGRFSN